MTLAPHLTLINHAGTEVAKREKEQERRLETYSVINSPLAVILQKAVRSWGFYFFGAVSGYFRILSVVKTIRLPIYVKICLKYSIRFWQFKSIAQLR